MNVKKQLNKIAEYIKEIEEVNQILNVRLARYENNNEQELHISGNFCGDVMEKIVDNVWQPIEHEHPEYAKVVDENARLREALRWHPVSEKPKKDIKCLTPESENVILQIDKGYYPVTAYCSLVSGIWRELKNHEEISVNKRSRWCYIPEDKDGE
jgi:hypothetical protein